VNGLRSATSVCAVTTYTGGNFMAQRCVCLIWCLAVGNFISSARANESEEKKPANTPIGVFVPHAGYLRNVKTMQLMRRAQSGIAIPLAPGTPLAIQG